MRYSLGDVPEIGYVLRVNGVPADATVTAAVTKPDGTAGVASIVDDPGLGNYHAVVSAVDQSGVWRGAITASGAATDVQPFVFYVTAAGAELPWAPSFADVGSHVPMRTIEIGDLTGTPTNTFSPATMPDDIAVSVMIDGAVQRTAARVGVLDATLYPLGTEVAALYAAAAVELAQPSDEQDTRRYDQLIAAAELALDQLADRNGVVTGEGGEGSAAPYYYYPDPVPWGDRLVL